MKKFLHSKINIIGSLLMMFSFPLFSQNYNMPGGTINTCSGMFYDTGGPAGAYTNNQNITTTFCSDIPGEAIQLAFSAFATESCCDHMTIYDGPTTGSPVIGVYNGSNSPGTVIGSSSCITIRFTSDGSITAAGWAAAISCVTPAPPSTNYNMPGGTINTCSGMFYDTGGSGGQYTNGQNITTTFCSDIPGEAIQLAFSAFATESCCDHMTIYDGPTTGSPVIGVYNGSNSPGTVIGSSSCITVQFTSDGSVVANGWAASISCVTPLPPSSNYNMPGGTITTCSGMFYDTGGAGGQYTNGQNITTTFCSNTPGEAVILNFTQFSTESCCDHMTIYDGPSSGSPSLGTYNGTNSPGTITGSGDCITVVFTSDGSVTAPGWAASISCGTPAPPPPPSPPQDCAGAVQICDDQTFSGNSSGPGNTQELNFSNQGCMSTEHQSSWYYFTPTVNGTLEFTINTTVDYDFAIWNSANCGNLGSPVRCSWSAINGPTGLGNGAMDTSEGAGGNAWVAPLNVVVGQFYILLVDNFTADNTSFSIDFNFSSNDLLNCVPIVLPIELVRFEATPMVNHVNLDWITETERENDYFIVQRSKEGKIWEMIGAVDGNGTTTETHFYTFIDKNPLSDVSYYRFKQVDFNGDFSYSPIRTVHYLNDNEVKVYPIPSDNHFYVDLNGFEFTHAEIVDLAGRVINTDIQQLNDNKLQLTIASKSSGIYTLRLYDVNGSIVTKKIVLK